MKNSNIVLNMLIISSCFMVGCNEAIPNETISVGRSISIGTSKVNTVTTNATTTFKETTSSETVNTTSPVIFGYKLDELNNIAQDLYNQSCDKYRSILIDGSYGVDFGNYIVDQSSKRYFLVTNPYYTTIENVFEDWHTIFNENYDELINSTYIMYDEYLYAYTGIQQVNTNYKDTTLTYYSTTDNEVTFKATCNYSSGDKIFKFSILYYPDTAEWRVSQFTMPY